MSFIMIFTTQPQIKMTISPKNCFFFVFFILKSSSQYKDTCGFQLTSREESETEQMELCTFR